MAISETKGQVWGAIPTHTVLLKIAGFQGLPSQTGIYIKLLVLTRF